jgi:hypothetical protein
MRHIDTRTVTPKLQVHQRCRNRRQSSFEGEMAYVQPQFSDIPQFRRAGRKDEIVDGWLVPTEN